MGIDIGGKPDPLSLYREFFPLVENVITWDLEDGDAQVLSDIPDETYDFVHSSHCLEHLRDPKEGLLNWFRILKPGGYLVCTVPDEDLYEQGVFPSTFNSDHKWTFSLYKKKSWSPKSLNIIELIQILGEKMEPVRLQLLDANYRSELPRYDQTITPVAECGIEVILRKRTSAEVQYGGIKPSKVELTHEMKLHLNQYRDDIQTIKRTNRDSTPFMNDKDIN